MIVILEQLSCMEVSLLWYNANSFDFMPGPFTKFKAIEHE